MGLTSHGARRRGDGSAECNTAAGSVPRGPPSAHGLQQAPHPEDIASKTMKESAGRGEEHLHAAAYAGTSTASGNTSPEANPMPKIR